MTVPLYLYTRCDNKEKPSPVCSAPPQPLPPGVLYSVKPAVPAAPSAALATPLPPSWPGSRNPAKKSQGISAMQVLNNTAVM